MTSSTPVPAEKKPTVSINVPTQHNKPSTKDHQHKQSPDPPAYAIGNYIGKCFEQFQSKSDRQDQKLAHLTALLERQEQERQDSRGHPATNHPCNTNCCPQPVNQHPQRMEMSVMVSPTINPNINIGSNQDFQHNGCRTVLAQETQTSLDTSPVDYKIDTSKTTSLDTSPVDYEIDTSVTTSEPLESCATESAATSTEVNNFLNSIDL
jgi:hypothetical protein